MWESGVGGGGILPLMASGFRLQVHVYKSVRFYKNVYSKSLYYYCMFSHSSQGNSMVRIISWKRPSLVTLLLLKQRELIRQETLCSGNSIVFIPNCLVASFSEAHPYLKPSLPLLRVFLKTVFLQGTSNPFFCSETWEFIETSASIIELDTGFWDSGFGPSEFIYVVFSWVRHFTLTLPHSTLREYKWIPANWMLGGWGGKG